MKDEKFKKSEDVKFDNKNLINLINKQINVNNIIFDLMIKIYNKKND